MSKSSGPDLTKYIDKQLALKLNANRQITGILRGFDQFMNVVLDDVILLPTQGKDGKQENLGTVMVRGNSILMVECLEKL